MSLLLIGAVVGAVVLAGLYFFVPSFHQTFLTEFSAARAEAAKLEALAKATSDSLVSEAETLVKKIEAHSKVKATEADNHHAAAQVFVDKEVEARQQSSESENLAKAIKSAVVSAK